MLGQVRQRPESRNPRCKKLDRAATSTTAIQIGAAVVGSLLNTRYQDKMSAALGGQHLPHAVMATVNSSLGGVLAVAARAGGVAGDLAI